MTVSFLTIISIFAETEFYPIIYQLIFTSLFLIDRSDCPNPTPHDATPNQTPRLILSRVLPKNHAAPPSHQLHSDASSQPLRPRIAPPSISASRASLHAACHQIGVTVADIDLAPLSESQTSAINPRLSGVGDFAACSTLMHQCTTSHQSTRGSLHLFYAKCNICVLP